MLRFLCFEMVQLLSKPLIWIGILVASIAIIGAVDQLDLDATQARILIVDSSEGHVDGSAVSDLVKQVSGVETYIVTPQPELMAVVDDYRPDIILSRKNVSGWQATLRSRSVVDHRRLARLSFTLAAVVNRQNPWDAVIGSDAFTAQDFSKTACLIGTRICAAYQWAGSPIYKQKCQSAQQMCGGGTAARSLEEAAKFSEAIREFCNSPEIRETAKSGICSQADAPQLVASTGMTVEPESHTRAFVPRTLALLLVFVSFVFACRSVRHDVRHNMLPVWIALEGGKVWKPIGAKLIVAVAFSILLYFILLAFSRYYYGLLVKPGVFWASMPVVLAIISSAMLGLAVGLFLREESNVYLTGAAYLLLLLILSGYLGTLRDDNLAIWLLSQALPLKHILPSFSDWLIFGSRPGLQRLISGELLAQVLFSLTCLFIASEVYRRRA